METHLECFPCLVRQCVDLLGRAGLQPDAARTLLRDTLDHLARADHGVPPPLLARTIFDRIIAASGDPDPLRDEKRWANELALGMLPALEARVAAAEDPFDAAVRLSVAGNVVDLGTKRSVSREEVERELDAAWGAPLRGPGSALLKQRVEAAERILFLTDNAGEIVLDRLLLDRLPAGRFAVAVRGAPTINDATLEDAAHAGLTARYEVFDNGAPYAGTHLAACSSAFRERFEAADLIIAKGQGNYETLCEHPGRPIVFLFKVKCEGVARVAGHPVGSLVCLPASG